MTVTTDEFQTNFNKYLELVLSEDVFITLNGKVIAKVINPQISAVDSIKGLLKDIPDNFNSKDLREERLKKYEDNV
ncbi:MAG: type II toxin-antitoxin system Phd/YefM family antitoxin [Ruminococcus flavefaciens]|nr:type II toxin-antitoxin system Phd/YefM family antitoxin [Ruminococcus flavefaciens]MCM1231203.1 type II toxin-antitoxin system Phd/YefM family antitoxin [Ruminococcus flavefaciens]